MKATTCRRMTTVVCVIIGLLLIPVIVEAFVLRVNQTMIPKHAHSDVRVMFYAGVGWTASRIGLPENNIPRCTFDKVMLIANDQVKVVFHGQSNTIFEELYNLFSWADSREIMISIAGDDGSNKATITVPRNYKDDLKVQLARIKAGEKINWQAEADAYKLEQTKAKGQFPTSGE